MLVRVPAVSDAATHRARASPAGAIVAGEHGMRPCWEVEAPSAEAQGPSRKSPA